MAISDYFIHSTMLILFLKSLPKAGIMAHLLLNGKCQRKRVARAKNFLISFIF